MVQREEEESRRTLIVGQGSWFARKKRMRKFKGEGLNNEEADLCES